MSIVRRGRFALLRTRQTLSVFDNGWDVLRRIVVGGDELVYRVGPVQITGPNAPGARVPVYEVFAEDEYGMDWFAQGLGDAPALVDIGAHIGCFSIAFATRFAGATVDAFEPTPSTGSFLQRNVDDNGLADRVRVHREAVSASAGVLVMADNGAGSGHNGVLHLGEAGAVSIEVPCVGLASVLESAGDRVDIMKMDAEGAEYDVILNSPPERWAAVRRLVMEYHPLPGHSFDELETYLAGTGLTLVRRDRYTDGLGLAWFSRDALTPPA